MDPKKTLETLIEAVAEEDWTTAASAAEALREWLDRGGFSPLQVPEEAVREWAGKIEAYLEAYRATPCGRRAIMELLPEP